MTIFMYCLASFIAGGFFGAVVATIIYKLPEDEKDGK